MKLLFPMLSDFVVLFEDAELEVRAVAGAALSNLARSGTFTNDAFIPIVCSF